MLLAVEVARAGVGFDTLLESEVSGISVALLVGVGELSVSHAVSVASLLRVGAFAIP
jgi:hypothetical protein